MAIKDADQWALVGEGYNSETEASEAGVLFRDALLLTLAKLGVGVDCGKRSPKVRDRLRAAILRGANRAEGFNNVHGLMTYVSDPPPRFIEIKTAPVHAKNIETFEERFLASIALQPTLGDQDRLSLSLFHASFFQPTADSRFLLLVMAIEALIEPKPKSEEAIKYVEGFIEKIEASSLRQDEKSSLIGSLEFLRNESIGQAGRRLVTVKLGDKLYQDKPAPKFLSYVYTLRSRLVHGAVPGPNVR